jgi:multiple sugar transport system substrate-binding protein
MMSEDAQVEVLAKDGNAVSRGDLADNEYAAADPRLVTINEVAAQGDTPVALNFQQAFNAPGSPWLTLVRNAVLNGDDSVPADNEEITAILSQSSRAGAARIASPPHPPVRPRTPDRKRTR